MIEIAVECQMCGGETVLKITDAAWQRYQMGEHIQSALSELDAGQRELLISRTCEKCFDNLFKENE